MRVDTTNPRGITTAEKVELALSAKDAFLAVTFALGVEGLVGLVFAIGRKRLRLVVILGLCYLGLLRIQIIFLLK